MVSLPASRFTPAVVEACLEQLLPSADTPPASVHAAMKHAVLSSGKRFRPRLVLGVAEACGLAQADEDFALRAACALELIHCGSLVLDDLPAFDDAQERRGRPTVHVAFGEPAAVLAGTALMCRGFEVLTSGLSVDASRTVRMLRVLAEATGSERGIIGGQGLEDVATSETVRGEQGFVDRYHALKTGALFWAAAAMGAIAASHPEPDAWGEVGMLLGRCYQIADDLGDVLGAPADWGKQVGVDARKQRPNAALSEGAEGARERLRELGAEVQEKTRRLAPESSSLATLLEGLSQHFAHAMREAV